MQNNMKPVIDLDVNVEADRKIPDNITILDKDWVLSKFMSPGRALTKAGRNIRYFSSAYFKTEDTSLGGNIAINAKSQYNMYCDPRPRRMADGKRIRADYAGNGDVGMGYFYSTTIHDNAEHIYLQAGVPEFNSLVSVIANAIDYDDAILANEGRTSTLYDLASVVGTVSMMYAFPLMSLIAFSIKGLSILLAADKPFNYYYMKPTMPTYWGMVNQITLQISTEIGLLSPMFMDKNNNPLDLVDSMGMYGKLGGTVKIDGSTLSDLKKLMPNLLTDANTIDVFAVAVKPQAMLNAADEYLYKIGDKQNVSLVGVLTGSLDAEKKLNHILSLGTYMNGNLSVFESDSATWSTGRLAYDIKNNIHKANKDAAKATADVSPPPPPADQTQQTSLSQDVKKLVADDNGAGQVKRDPDGGYTLQQNTPLDNFKKMGDVFKSAANSYIRDGANYAIFNVEYSGTGSDSFSNSFGSINTGSTINSYGGQARDLYFDLSGGNVVAGMDNVIQGVGDVLAGALNGVTFGMSNILAALSGGGRLSIPEKWNESSADLADFSYTMNLICTAGDPITALREMWIPLAMVLPFVLPQATGKSSYTSPMLCSLFNKGKEDKRLAMMSSLTIERGVTNLPVDKKRKPLGIKVTMRFKDLSPIMSVPAPVGIFKGIISGLDDTTPFAAYIRSLAARDLRTSKYFIPKAKLAISRSLGAANSVISPAAWGMRFGDKVPLIGGIVSFSSLSLNNNS